MAVGQLGGWNATETARLVVLERLGDPARVFMTNGS
jgi:hypothetical protein